MKLQGPMFSLGASGSIGGTVTFATWKGRPYARQLVIPSNPQSANQTANRAMFKFLSQAWGGISSGDQESWTDLAAQGNVSKFNAYQKFNMDFWQRSITPAQVPNVTPGTSAITTVLTATPGVKSITLSINPSATTAAWGFVIYRKVDAAPDGVFSEVVAIVPFAGDPTSWTDLGLITGTDYHYKAQFFNTAAEVGVLSADENATPT